MDGLSNHVIADRPSGFTTGTDLVNKGLVNTGGLPATWVPQCTLKSPIGCVGIGLHSGHRISVTLKPATPGTGIVFVRTDLGGVAIAARFDQVTDSRLCTVIAHPDHADARVGTIEHLMAAFAGCGIDNAVVELDGPEVPIFDGSAAPFVFLLECAGTVAQDQPRAMIEILRTVRVQDGEAFAELRPGAGPGLAMAFSIAFAAPAIGRQARSLRLSPAAFRQELARARTFTLASEVEGLRRAGLALGGSMDNAVVVDDSRVLNPGGLRMPDEFVRHKMLDAVGDLALAGAPIAGRFVAHRSGHGMNNRLLRALFADTGAWRMVSPGLPEWLSAAA